MTTVIARRYRIGDVIGRGGMGDVRDALDESLARPVAVKFMRADLADDAGLRRRFEREARAAARVSHPHVIAIYDVGEHDGVPFIVMERLSGRTLADELGAGPLLEGRVRAVAAEMLDALAAAHELGVIHRDVKPGNVLLRDDGHIAIADFGIATIADEATHATTGLLFGTARYLAPERLVGEPATPATDVYSAGVVMFEALTGRPAFRADTPLALATAVASEVPSCTPAERARFDPVLVTVIERAMAKDPSERFRSAPAMRDALDAPSPPHAAPTVPVRGAPARTAPTVPIAASPTQRLPVEPVPSEPVPVAGPRRRRGRFVFAAFVAVAVGAGAVVAATSIRDSSNPPPTTTTTAPPGSSAIPAPLRNAIDALDQAVDR